MQHSTGWSLPQAHITLQQQAERPKQADHFHETWWEAAISEHLRDTAEGMQGRAPCRLLDMPCTECSPPGRCSGRTLQ